MRQKKKLNEPTKRTHGAGLKVGQERDRQDSKKHGPGLAEAKRAVLERGWLAEHDRTFQTAVLQKALLREFPVGSRIFEVGDFRGGIYGVAGGAIAIKVPQRGGEERLAHICHSGVWFGYDTLLSRRHRNLAFVAIEPSIAFHVPLVALDKLAASDPRYHRYLTKIAAYGMDIAIATVSDLLMPNVDKRIASLLLRNSNEQGGETDGSRAVAGLTQAQIGEMASVARDVANRTLKRFEAKGWIEVSYKRITILEPAKLDSFCL